MSERPYLFYITKCYRLWFFPATFSSVSDKVYKHMTVLYIAHAGFMALGPPM